MRGEDYISGKMHVDVSSGSVPSKKRHFQAGVYAKIKVDKTPYYSVARWVNSYLTTATGLNRLAV